MIKRLSAQDDNNTATTNANITSGSITGITDLAVADGGTGASTAANARTNLGLGAMATKATVATADIDNDAVTYAKIQNVSATDKLLGRATAGAGDVEEITLTASGRALIDDASTSAQRTTLGLAIGSDVQAYDADLATIAGLTATTDNFIQSKSSAWASRTPAQAAADLAVEVGKLLHPVGSIYITTSSTNPATSLGFGTWSAFGAGRVPVGFDSGQTEFDVDEETGGTKSTTLTTTELPAHRHFVIASASVVSAALTNSNQVASARSAGNEFSYGIDNGATATDATIGRSSSSGSGSAFTNLPPYIVVRMWKRTA